MDGVCLGFFVRGDKVFKGFSYPSRLLLSPLPLLSFSTRMGNELKLLYGKMVHTVSTRS